MSHTRNEGKMKDLYLKQRFDLSDRDIFEIKRLIPFGDWKAVAGKILFLAEKRAREIHESVVEDVYDNIYIFEKIAKETVKEDK